ncbi:protein shisa-4 [Latimeria chalumnae]|uniref:Shisa family member 4 n=1 Tax=Latimeria chalumnae TaxID=7897 RepID=H3AYY6_LATCH|nr:PREDICTED: protein shisa-4 [Latimeria chalumnae]|eukprot:XP_005988454.1 PREDICTED: protein shisa-4 [Latimeria chalumnae]
MPMMVGFACQLAVVLLVFSSGISSASANDDCLMYMDKNGTWYPGFGCPIFSFCCGNCYRRYCCQDLLKLITERQQKHCMTFYFSPKVIAGIASAIILFVAVIVTAICCFMCSCCYLYQQRMQMGTPFEGPSVPMSSYPAAQEVNLVHPKAAGEPYYPGYGGVPTYPAPYPPYPPTQPMYNPAAPPPYVPPKAPYP